MPRTARFAPGGMVYHVLHRGVGKNKLFFKDEDYLAFERVIVETLDKRSMRILSYCLMPNHWHFVLWPEKGKERGRSCDPFLSSCLWAAGMEAEIKPDLNAAIVGKFSPTPYTTGSFAYEGVKPSDLAGWDTAVMPA